MPNNHRADVPSWRKRSEIFERIIADELILITDRGAGDLVYVIRQSSGRVIWKLLADARTCAGLANELARARQRTRTALDDSQVDDFIRKLADAGLIVPVSGTALTIDPSTPDPLTAADEVAPILEPVELGKLLPEDLVLQGLTVGFHAAGNNMTGGVC